MTKKILLSISIFILFAPLYSIGSIEEFLKTLPIENIKVLEKEAFYSKIFEVSFTQAIDHNNPEMGSFGQRLYISHVDASLPVVLVTEGYTAGYYYTSEPAALLKCNQIISEHRYFGESSPDSIQWEYLTTWQSASDHHHIIEAFKEFYQSDWITTGISKGGQTVMYHSYYYPDDVKVRMPYVAPLNDNTEDQRIYSFLDHVGSSKCRRRIRKFQKNSLKKEEQLIPVFKDFCKRKEYTFELLGGIEKAFEYCVLEYSFAFWQWMYSPCSSIPGKRTKPEDIIIHMNMVAGFDYFADEFVEPYRPFFYQAYTEMGYYGYDLDKFKPWLNYATERGFEYTLPKNVDISFDKTISEGLNEYIKNEADNFIFIYGEYDTWSATAVELNQNENSVVFYKKKGSHRTRVRNMPEEQQEEVKAALDMYLSE